ncbi:hypothetical protein DMC30DRAFT_407206 [Rhodotorula diobovata]|uniref:Uncharacterized protein n=1 Tax=Rhodotorula diobovata TaxID=5288 RepID=A0A5C5FLB8_9BASI|nr:hypothetical protein DMC30DRAFT_407206 [Rhodotorula diobovata]
MAKLRKARNGTLAPPAPSATSSSSSPAAPGGSTSTPARRPPSLLSTSSAGKRTSPIAVRSTGTLAPSVSASRIEARGELIEGELSEAESRSVTLHSRSPTASSFHSRGTASSPPASPRSHRRLASNASTADSFLTPATSPEQPRCQAPRAPSFASSSAAAGDHLASASSALAKLRTRLDSDQVAREAQRLREEHAHSTGGKLRKKLPREVALEAAAHEHIEHENIERVHAVQEEGVEAEGSCDAEEEAAAQGLPSRIEEGQEDEASGAGQDGTLKPGEAVRIEAALEGLNTAALAPSPQQGSLLFAPARLGWRLASSAVYLGVGTTRSVLSRVPVVSGVVESVDSAAAAVSERVAARTERLEELATALSSASSRAASPSTRRSSYSVPNHSWESSTSKEPSEGVEASKEPPSALARIASVPLAPARLAYRVAELSLTLSLASLLVASTVTGMAWDRVRGRPVRSVCE